MTQIENIAYFPDQLETGECELVGPENILIPEGIYQASYLHYETSGMYSKKINQNRKQREGGKLYLWFWIDPYSEKLNEVDPVELYIPYNTDYVELPTGKRGKFGVTRKSNYYKDFKRLFGSSRRDRVSPIALKDKLCLVRVGTVKTNERQKNHSADNRYSVIREIIELTG